LHTSSPAACGLDAARLTRIDDWMRRYVDGGRFPFAATLIARKGAIAWASHYGQADVDAGTAYTPETLVRIYSMTKPVTSTALMMLYERGLLHLDDPVAEFIPAFADVQVLVPDAERPDQTEPLKTPLTVHNLLTHTAGLTYGFNQDILSRSLHAKTASTSVSRPAASRQPPTGWLHSPCCSSRAAVGTIPLQPMWWAGWSRWCPASRSTGSSKTTFSARWRCATRASPFLRPRWAGSVPAYAFDPKGGLPVFATNFAQGEVDTFSGGGGLVSTGRDYLRFAEMLRRGGALGDVRLLGPRTVRLMTSNHLPGGVDLATLGPSAWCETSFTGVGFGLGFAVNLSPRCPCCRPALATFHGVAWRRPISGAIRQKRCRWCF
jgi:CubicO group peptidase (beta-lactamase class C family)